MEKVDRKLYCRGCKRRTNHQYLQNRDGINLEYLTQGGEYGVDIQYIDRYYIIQCMGCDEIAFLRIYGDEAMYIPNEHDEMEYFYDYMVYPEEPKETDSILLTYESPFHFNKLPNFIMGVREEVVKAYQEGMGLLCSMGIRMLVEAICKEKGIIETQRIKNGAPLFDQENNPVMRNLNLYEKIEELYKRGIITEPQKNILQQIRNLGNEAAHDISHRKQRTIKKALQIVENILYNIYELPNITIEKKEKIKH